MRLVKALGVLVVLAGVVLAVAAGRTGFAEGRPAQPAAPAAPALAFPFGGSQLGVSVRNVQAADVNAQKLPRAEGVIVVTVAPDGPAAQAGLQAGDVIVTFDGEAIRSVRQFTRLVDESVAGRSVTVAIVRDGSQTTHQVTPGATDGWPDRAALNRSLRRLEQLGRELPMELHAFAMDPGGPRFGATVEDMTHALAAYFGAKEGVLVTSVATGSEAEKAELKVGDVITSVAGHGVASRWAFMSELRHAGAGHVVLGLIRDHKAMRVTVNVTTQDKENEGMKNKE